MLNESFFKYLQFEKRFSGHTLTAYRKDLDQFSAYVQQQYELDDLSACSHGIIRSWLVQLMEQGIQPRSVNRKISTLKSYYKFLQKETGLQNSPMDKITSPKVPKRLPQFVDQKHMDQLLERNDFDHDFKGLRDRLIVEMFYATGLRISELISIEDAKLDLAEGQLKVLGKRNKERIVPIPAYLHELIVLYRQVKNHSSTYFFTREGGEKLYPELVYRLVKSELAKVSTLEKRSPHILRHTFATHLLNNGADLNAIKEILGHSSLAATQVYTHNSIEKLKQIYKQAHPKG